MQYQNERNKPCSVVRSRHVKFMSARVTVNGQHATLIRRGPSRRPRRGQQKGSGHSDEHGVKRSRFHSVLPDQKQL